MSAPSEKLNLRTGEKRLLVAIGIVLFIVLNVLFVWPKFGEYGRVRTRTDKVRQEIAKFQAEIDKAPTYQKVLKEMEGQGSRIVKEEQSLRLLQTVQSQALASGVKINSSQETSRGFNIATNAFFDEQSIVVSYDTGYRQLVDFLVGLAEHESMVRVRHMDVRRAPNTYSLQGNLTLVASYQKSRPSPSAAAPQPAATASNK
jgi:Tfp pilus assembly protein PilO